jgi:cellulose synthase/poly-beta-1,6-N-acetylglucosamine synthase-like glycosyltransferase
VVFERCLESLSFQQRLPDEVVVVVRDTDAESRAVLARWQSKSWLRVVDVQGGGQVRALNAGLDAVTGEIVMITDDDAVAHEDWCRIVEKHFLDNPKIGGVGGRDIVYAPEGLLEGHCTVIGRVQFWGRIVGNHHLINSAITDVDLLKGANMSYRMAAVRDLRFDNELRGVGAQVGNDMAFSLAVAAREWRLIYDPAVQVDHYPAQRFDQDIRGVLNLDAVENVSFNRWWTLNHHLRPGSRRAMALLWEALIGAGGHPGWLRGWIATLRRDSRQMQTWSAARRGRRAAGKRDRELRRQTPAAGR